MARWSPLILLLLVASSLRAQAGSPRLELAMPAQIAAKGDGPTVSLGEMLTEGHRRDLLTSGWPTVMRCRVELWKKGFIAYSTESVSEWDYVVEYSPMTESFQIRRQQQGRVELLGTVKTIADAEQIVDRPVKLGIVPKSPGARYYYVFSVDLSTLNMSDLDAWQRWVRGDATPAVQGKGSLWSAFKKGLGSLASRMLGGDNQHYERRSAPFTAG
jgi:hypothetical protein